MSLSPPSRITRAVFGAMPEQRADREAGAAAGPQLQHLAEQNEHGDHRGGVEVRFDHTVDAEAVRKESGTSVAATLKT